MKIRNEIFGCAKFQNDVYAVFAIRKNLLAERAGALPTWEGPENRTAERKKWFAGAPKRDRPQILALPLLKTCASHA